MSADVLTDAVELAEQIVAARQRDVDYATETLSGALEVVENQRERLCRCQHALGLAEALLSAVSEKAAA